MNFKKSRMKSKFKRIYLPLEIMDREIDGACLLALEAVKKGWEVIVGAQPTIMKNIESSQKGVYFLKSITPGQIDIQKRIINSGSYVVCQDQEGLLQRPGMSYRIRFSKESLSLAKKVFFWGELQKNEFTDALGEEHLAELVISGSPRADHWELISQKLKKSVNTSDKEKCILVATSFGKENHALGKDGHYNLLRDVAGIKYGANDSASFHQHFQSLLDLGNYVLPYYKELVIDLAKNLPEEKIIIRPHPSENVEMWKDLTKGFSNIEVNNKGTIIEWILRSKLLIQYASSSAIQASILRKPVFSLIPDLPDNLKSLDLLHSKEVSTIFNNVEDLVDGCINLCSNPDDYETNQHEFLDQIIYSRRTVDSSKRIINELDKLFPDLEFTGNNNYRPFLSYKFSRLKYKITLLLSLIPFWKKIVPQKYKHVSLFTYLYYKTRKQPSCNIVEFKEKINEIKSLTNNKIKIKVQKFKKNVFKLNKI